MSDTSSVASERAGIKGDLRSDNVLNEPRLRVIESEKQDKPGELRLLSCEGDRGGNAHVRYLRRPDAAVEFLFLDEHNDLHPARTIRVRTDLATSENGKPQWRFGPRCPSFSGGENVSPEWSLPGESTVYLVSAAGGDRAERGGTGIVGTATLLGPASGELFSLSPKARYEFSVLGAVHRCLGRIRIEFVPNNGMAVRLASRRIAPSAIGGAQESGFDRIGMEFIVPEGGKVRIVAEKGETETGKDSYVFLARPSLRELRRNGEERPAQARAEREPVAVNLDLCDALVAPPAPLLKGGEFEGVLRLRSGSEVVDHPVHLSVSSAPRAATAVGQGVMRFEGLHAPGARIQLALYVDGQLSNRDEFPVQDGAFSGILPFDYRHLDGLPHYIELRVQQEHLLLGSCSEILPAFVTPWDALQTYARMPLGIANAPAAPHHFRAFRRWLIAFEGGECPKLPPLVKLHNRLLEGISARRHYDPLAFTTPAKPVVSVIVPVHNKFEVTYFGLSALLFAHNRVPFEVVVVDDGSSDLTMRLEELVTGVKIVRHEHAQGFVGACNAGANIATGEFVAFLNNDTEVTAGWLDELVETFENFRDVGLAGSKLLYPDGRLQEAGGVVWRSGNPWNVGRGSNAEDPAFNYVRQADYLSGAAIMLRRELFARLGRFSEEFAPAYFEDTDLAMKVRDHGLRVVYVPTSVVFHYEGQSAGTDISSGMKRFQEVNRPKFKRKWVHLYSRHGEEGLRPDLEKDRNAAFRVLFIDHQVPVVDQDAGSYAAFQEIRLLQGLGGKVTFLPRNLAWLDRHTLAVERLGVECLYAPYIPDFAEYIVKRSADYDLVYVCRYNLAQQVIPLVRRGSPRAKIAFNFADLHFLRELREVASGNPSYSDESAAATRTIELEQTAAADLALSYSDIEMAVLQSHLGQRGRIAKLPWVLDVAAQPLGAFEDTSGALFLGSFGHPPNQRAVQFFAQQVLPRLRERFPDFRLRIVGGQLVDGVRQLESDAVEILGYVPDLDEVFRTARVFVAPLLAGAGIKGKVLEAAARGVPSVLSSIAAEGTGMADGMHCLIAGSAESWVTAVSRLNSDRELWTRIAACAQDKARQSYSYEKGVDAMAEALAMLDIYGRRDTSLVYRHARPRRYGLD